MFLGLLDSLNTCVWCVCGIVIKSGNRKLKITQDKPEFSTEPEKRYPKVTKTRQFLPNLITSMECGYTSNLNWWLHYEHFWFQKQPIKIRFSSLPCLAIYALKNQQTFRNKKNLTILRL